MMKTRELFLPRMELISTQFALQYVRVETDHSYGFDVEMGVHGTRVHYP